MNSSFRRTTTSTFRIFHAGLLRLRTRRGKLFVLTSLATMALIAVCSTLASRPETQPVNSAPSASAGTSVTVNAAGRGKPFFNFADGRQMSPKFRAQNEASQALQSGQAASRALASADLDGDGTPDVVAGYAYGGTGIVTIQRGNPDAYAPADDSVFVRIQQGYNPTSLLDETEVYQLPVPADFVAIGNFKRGASKDILIGAKGGGIYLIAGQGKGFGSPEQINLPGPVTALAVGEFRSADGVTDVAVGVTGAGGDALLIFDGAEGLSNPLVQYPLAGPASAIEFGGLDDDPFQDVAVAAGNEIDVVHGWGRKSSFAPASRIERIGVGSNLCGLALGEFTWDRDGRTEIAALTDDGTVQIVQRKQLDTREFTETEKATRNRGRLMPQGTRLIDIEALSGWQPGKAPGWSKSKSFATGSARSTALKPLMKTHLSQREMDEITVIGKGQSKFQILRPFSPNDPVPDKELLVSDQSTPEKVRRGNAERDISGDATQVTLDVASEPIAMLTLPKKINGEEDVVYLSSGSKALSIVPNAPNTTITVDRTDDPAGAALTTASACTAAGNDCSLRGAFQFANHPSNNNTTINLPANTYILSINGSQSGGCFAPDDNTVGDLTPNQSLTITGAGAATTIIRQTGTGPANDGDRIMCMNTAFASGLVFNFSGVSFVGGREGVEGSPNVGAALGGAGIIGGELNNSLTLTNVVFANNQSVRIGDANLGGGGLQITGGSLTITNSTFGGSSAPGAYTDRSNTNTGNSQVSSGGGLTYTPSSPGHTGGSGTLTITGSTFSRNTASGLVGGGVDLLIFAFASPGGIGSGTASISTSTFSNNQALGTTSGGGIGIESLPTTVATTSFTNNSAGNRGGAIYLGGGSLLLNGTTPSITMTGNTATSGGTSVSTTGAPVTVDGTNTTLGGDIQINTGGTWTNNAGSTLSPTDVVITGGTFNMNNSTMNVSGNLTIASAPLFLGTFNGGSGTVNIQGNFIYNAAGPSTTVFNAGTGTFNFNGTGARSISNDASITFFNLTDSNVTQPLTLNNSFNVNGTLNVNGANAILSPVAGAVIGGTGTLTGAGTARASRITATPDFLSQYTITNKTLTNLTIDYNGAGNQTVNNTPAYSQLRISGSGTKTLQGNTVITSNLNIIAGSTFAGSTFNFGLGGNWTNGGTFTPGTGTVTFQGTTGIQTLTGNTTFFNLTLNNTGATTNFSNTTATVGNDLVASAGTMDGGTSTIIFTGVTDNLGSISGVAAKNFHNLQVNSPATISNTAGANITIEGNYSNAGTFSQGAGLTTIFGVDNTADGNHSLSGAGTTTFGNFTINSANAVDAGSHNFNVVGAAFTSTGTFTGNTGTVTFNGGVAQSITGDGLKNFGGLLVNNANGVSVLNSAQAVDATVLGILTLNTDLTVTSGAILQQGGTSAGAADVLGTVRRTDLGGVTRSFGNLNNTIQINSGTPPTQMDFNLVKVIPTGFPAAVKVVPRTYTLSPTGGAGLSATLRLRYIDPAELSGPGITESRLVLWKDTTGSDNWVAQGGAVDTAGNHVTHTGITSFSEWAIAEASDLTLSKANNVSGSAVVGQSWNWTLTASNTGSPATFTAGQTILTDNLPNTNLNYGTPTVQNATNITGSANISCSIASNNLTCTANGGNVTFDSNVGASSFQVVFSATPQAAGSYQNPRTGGGIAQIDPNNLIAESNETNNSPVNNTVTVGKANTTTVINSDNPDPSVVGQPVTVTWSVTVNGPGAVGAPLTGNVTVSDGTNQCVAALSAGQCDVTFTSAGAKSLTATYAGDLNYNGSASTPATPHTVNAANTTTTITEDNPDPSTPGASVTVKWTVTVNSPGAGTPAGTVTVTVSGGAETCNAPVATGQCSLNLTATGNRTITATYASANANFNASSDTESHDVCGGVIVTTAANSGAGSLRQVIAEACAGSTIDFAIDPGAGPHTITLTTGELVLNKNLTIQNTSGESVTVSGNNASRVFNVNSGKTVAISNLTVTAGSATGAVFPAMVGGAIFNEGTLTLTNIAVSNSSAANFGGGGIYNLGATATANLINSTVSGNDALGTGGGGGIFNNAGTVTLTNSTVSGNDANADGGGINNNSGTLTVTTSTISGNNALLTGSGGGVINFGTLTVTNATISGNNANNEGGGIFNNHSSGSVTLTSVTVTNNRADADNNAAGTGGGIFIFNTSLQPLLQNTIVAGNFNENGASDAADDIAGTVNATSSFNLIGTGGAGGLTNGTNNNQVNVASPGLGSLTNNGGPTETHALQPGSPAIDQGDDFGITTDQRGQPRPLDTPTVTNAADGSDIGAFEKAFSTIPLVTTTGGALAYTENAPATVIDPGLTVTDDDSTNLAGATVAITANFASGQDVLGFVNTATITGNYDSGTGVLTLSGTDTVANYQAALRAVTYQNSSDNPSTLTRTMTFTANDGTNTGSNTRGIAVTAVNDAPVNTVPGAQTTNPNTALTFSSGNGNQISVADVDAGAGNLRVQLSVTNGQLTLSTTSGLSFACAGCSGDGTADASMGFEGTIANINTALNGLTFNPTAGFSGAATLNIVTNDLGNSGSGGPLSDSDTVNIQVANTVSVKDAKAAEPASGSTNMTFTVVLSSPAGAGPTSVNFTTADEPAGPGKAVAGTDYTTTSGTISFAAGQQVRTINVPVLSDGDAGEPDETFLVNLTGPTGVTIQDNQAVGTITAANPAGTFIISELRTSGPGGLGDDFVELYNNTDTPLTVAASDASAGYGIFKMGADCNATPVLIGTIPNGTVIPARGHYLLVGSQYSLGNYGGSGAAAGNLTMSSDIESDRNVAVFSTANVANVSSTNRLDAVGFGTNVNSVCDLLREPGNLGPASGSTLQHTYFRKQCDFVSGSGCSIPGNSKDTNANSADFMFADTMGTFIPGTGQQLGAPGPENLASPLRRDTTGIGVVLLDGTKTSAASPNRARDLTPGDPNFAANGTMSVRRRVVNNTGATVTRLRFRIVEITTFPNIPGLADLRALTSSAVTISGITDAATCASTGTPATVPCQVTAQLTTLETPPNQPVGGGYNATLSLAVPGGLANNASIDVNFTLGVQTPGSFRFLIIVEALP